MKKSNLFFNVINFDNKRLMEQAYRLRYKIYCEKKNFLNKTDYPVELEFDKYDRQSVHFGAFDQDAQLVGYLRLILPGRHQLPVFNYCSSLAPGGKGYGEISRFIIDSSLLPSSSRRVFSILSDCNMKDPNYSPQEKNVALGLYKLLYLTSTSLYLFEWYAMMERALSLYLRLCGFTFEKIGDKVDYYGPVYPYKGTILFMIYNVKKRCPWLYKFFSDDPTGRFDFHKNHRRKHR